MSTLSMIMVLTGLIVIYFMPALLAWKEGNRNAGAIFVANLFFGWTLIGWVLVLIWALMRPAQSAR